MKDLLSATADSPVARLDETATPMPRRRRYGIFLLLAAALAVRLLVFFAGLDNGLFYPDEAEYIELAKNLAVANEFSYKDHLTSFRPPGFAFLMALIFRLFDTTSPVPVRVMQIAFSMLTVWVIYLFGRDGWGEKVGLIAAGIFAFYPSFVGFNNMLLTEPSNIFCLSLACWAMVRHLRNPHAGWAAGAGVALGLGTLIRDTLFYGGPVTTLFLLVHAWRDRRYRWHHIAAFAGGFVIVIAPWIIRNTLLHGQFTMISTVGGINLYLCNTHESPMIHTGYIFIERAIQGQDGYYYDSLFPELKGASETAKQNLAMQKGLAYMLEYPWTTFLRSLSRFVDFWGQERLVINQVMANYYGEAPAAVLLLVILAVFVSFSSVVIASSFGYCFTKLDAFDIFGLVFIAYYTGMHALVLGHPRYHLPLLPFLAVVAARACVARAEIRANWRSRRFVLAMSIIGVFVIVWIIGIFFFDPDKIEMLMQLLK
jgi:4-amino-4-deoxy-L-arabinose transferase-like glycosyltransferase